MQWKSVRDLLSEFSIERRETDLTGIRQDLKTCHLAQVHPDATGGKFQNEEQRARYERIMVAIEFLDRESASGTALTHRTATYLSKARQKAEERRERQETLAEYRAVLHGHLALPRISSGIMSSICIAAFTFLPKLQDNPGYTAARSFVMPFVAVGGSVYIEHDDALSLNQLVGAYNVNEELTIRLDQLRQAVHEFPTPDSSLSSQIRIEQVGDRMSLSVIQSESSELVNIIGSLTTREPDDVRRKNDLLLRAVRLKAEAEHWAEEVKPAEDGGQSFLDPMVLAADRIIGGFFLFLSIVFGLLTLRLWLRERSDSRWGEILLGNAGLRICVERLVAAKGKNSNEAVQFTKSDMIEALCRKQVPPRSSWLLGTLVDRDAVDPVADSMLLKLSDRGLIENLTIDDVEDWFEIAPAVVFRYSRPVPS